MQTIRTRLTLNYLLVLLLGMALAGALVWWAVERLYVNTQRENLLAQARLMAAALQGTNLPTGPIQPYSQTSNVMPGIHARILGEGGAVIVGLPTTDEFTQAPAAEDYVSIPTSELVRRPEIASALNGTPATALRRVLDNRRVLYAAAPLSGESGQIAGIVYIAMPLPAAGLPTNLLLQLLSAVCMAILLAMFFGGLLAQKIARPLEGLASAAASISEGDLKTRVSTDNDVKELQHLSQAFNDMAENLRQSDEAKKAFLADVTHELRTPLTVIKGTIETLEDGALDDVEGRGPLLASMQRETDRLIRLVNELLVLTRADAGSLQLHLQTLNLAELVKARCDVFAGIAARKGIELHSKADCPSDPLVKGDPDRIAQVLDNLLDNGIRHSPGHASITVMLQLKEAGVECSVTDHGTGIPPEHLPYIFERFYRVDSARARRDGGTGLGLAIAKALVHAQGGQIHAESREGEGTTIRFWLPYSETASVSDNA